MLVAVLSTRFILRVEFTVLKSCGHKTCQKRLMWPDGTVASELLLSNNILARYLTYAFFESQDPDFNTCFFTGFSPKQNLHAWNKGQSSKKTNPKIAGGGGVWCHL